MSRVVSAARYWAEASQLGASVLIADYKRRLLSNEWSVYRVQAVGIRLTPECHQTNAAE